jgi:membrane protein implicated in regulation of membrane protease activity
MGTMIWVWLGAAAVFAVLEAVTVRLVSIWFVCGAVAAMLAAVLHASLTAQILLFAAVSAVALAATRPLMRRMTRGKITRTNADRVLGREAKVTEIVDNDAPSGAVYVDGKTWTARSADGAVIPVGAQVTVKEIAGVKLVVEEKKEAVS